MKQHRGARKNGGFTLLELAVVILLIGIIAAGGIKYYQELLEESRRAGMEMLAHRFATATSLVHAQWILQGGPSRRRPGLLVDVDGIDVYVNERGWPANTDGGSARSHDQTDSECKQLWQALLQNPAPATVGGAAPAGNETHHRFHIRQIGGRVCRYQMVRQEEQYFFDYHLTTGQILMELPPRQPINKGGGKARIN